MTNFYWELHDALLRLTAPESWDSSSVRLAHDVLGYDPEGISYSTEKVNTHSNTSDQLPLSLVLHLAALRIVNSARSFPLENVDPLVSHAMTVAESMGRSEAALPYELLLLEKLSAPRSTDRPRLFDLGRTVDWSLVSTSLAQELTALEQALGSRPIAKALGQPVGGNLPLGKGLVPLLCERGLVVSPDRWEDTLTTLARGLYLLERYNAEPRHGDKPLLSVGIYSTQGHGERSLRVFELPRILPMDSFLSRFFGV